MTTALDRLIATPRKMEVDRVDLAAPPERIWEIVRYRDLARPWLVRVLFAVRALPSRLVGKAAVRASLRIDDLVSSPQAPGFQVLADEPPHEVVVGAIGKVWRPEIPFVHLDNAEAFSTFEEPGFVKVAWAVRLSPLGEGHTRLVFELRVDATDDGSWKKFCRYFRVIGLGSRFIRRSLLAGLARELGRPESKENLTRRREQRAPRNETRQRRATPVSRSADPDTRLTVRPKSV